MIMTKYQFNVHIFMKQFLIVHFFSLADLYFEPQSSAFDFLTNEKVEEQPDSLRNGLDNNKGIIYMYAKI